MLYMENEIHMDEQQDLELVVTFDLGNFVNENSTEIEQFNEDEIDDNDLIQLVSNLKENEVFHDRMLEPNTDADENGL